MVYEKKAKLTEAIIAFFMVAGMVGVGLSVAVAGDEAKYETGVVRTKKDSALYVSPLNDTLVNRKIQFTGSAQCYKAYETIQIGDTVKFENPSRDQLISARYSYLSMKVNNKGIEEAIEQSNKAKQLQQIRRESRQK